MKDKVIVITGASDGIGAVTANVLYKKGATVVVIGRSPEKTKKVADSIHAPYFVADFSKLSEVRTLAENLKKNYPKIDILMNNAGGIFGDRELTEDGIEKTMQVNHVAPFLLTNLLMDTLLASKATVINTSSIASRWMGKIDINDINLENNYSANRAYGNSKLANILFTKELHTRYGDKGLSTVAVHPGGIATSFATDSHGIFNFIYHTPLKRFLATVEKGAEPLIWLATSKPGIDWELGGYYEKFKLGKLNPQAQDEKFISDFWDATELFI